VTTSRVAVIDAVRGIIPLAEGMTADETCAEPARVQPGRLYAWPRRFAPQKLEEDRGRWDEADLRIRMVWTVPAKGEPRAPNRDRQISEQLDAVVSTIHAKVQAHRRDTLWWDLYVEQVIYDAIRSDVARGVAVDLVARLNEPFDAAGSGS
jgi:hypothetical protein